eukprot:TRINITY_DN6222_c0_g1_i12.p1 TRINITY_DN6222_c0_g1~~TRINITY_DN6222_c0_g1_i12.p1  ORF type:complete len:579 (+),score=140.39 TRINITY_DN6222_c0_g1_i12:186-1739(+)
MYERPPHHDVSLQDFEDMAVERLKVLRTFEKHNMGGNTKFSAEWIDKIKADLDKHNLTEYYDLANMLGTHQKVKHLDNRKRDHISHFILRLAYCRSDELRRWFVTHETDLFRFRWKLIFKDNPQLLNQFMVASKISYQPISQAEKDALGEDLINGTSRGISAHKVKEDDFYKVPWLEAMDLVRGRRVLVRAGYAYIPRDELMSLVVGVFRSQLSHNLVLTCRALPVLEEDRRLANMLQNMDKRYTGEDFGGNKSGDRVTPEQVMNMADVHFPMCMRSLHGTLTGQHHLKYKARLQYGLFLKGIGMTLEDSIRFWRTEMTKRGEVDVDKFEKEYAYGIRYNYGKEGKKKNWQPWDCMRIIMENVGAGECHGCPFRHHEARVIKKELEKGISRSSDVDAIMKKVNEGHFQVACGMHFSAAHARDLTTGATNHPNQWYLESRNMLGNQENAPQGPGGHHNKIKTTHVNMYKSKGNATPNANANANVLKEKKSNVMTDQEIIDDMDDSELLSALDSMPVDM